MERAIPKVRLATGLILFAFVLCHFLNHSFGLVSLAAMDRAHAVFMTVWRTPIGSAILVGAALAHLAIALRAVYRRRTLKMAPWEAAQLALGLAIPPLLFGHILGTRVAELQGLLQPGYELTVAALWVGSPVDGVIQAVALVVVWAHGCVGLHAWLKVKPGYARWRRVLLLAAVVLPTLAISGYLAAGFELLSELDRDHPLDAIRARAAFDAAGVAALQAARPYGYAALAALLVLLFAARSLRAAVERLRPRARIGLPDGRRLRVPPGATALETLRAHGVPHASVCGGRGRCTTCRVRVMAGHEALAPPEPVEAGALSRIGAAESVRLACQIRTGADLAITPLLPPDASAADGRQPGGLAGEERALTCLFIDIRGSTRLGEEKLPYDVLFILNQFFAEMTHAVAESGGHYAQFNGDGLMALYGLDASPETGARRALDGARRMLARVARLNAALESELPFPLTVGIGIHHGEAIVGAMGPPDAQITSAIGDTINIAARLEGLSKDYGAPLIVSKEAAAAAGFDPGPDARRDSVAVRGRERPVGFIVLEAAPEGREDA